MPYRRLPKTDLGRIKALQKIVSMEGHKENGQLVLSYQTIRDTQQLLSRFRNAHRQYQQYYDQSLVIGKEVKKGATMARLYVSHFIQVLNMCIQRGELPGDIKVGYGLDPATSTKPSLTADKDLAYWGQKIIEGEENRVRQGGLPIYNPNIGKVKVYYSIFAEQYYSGLTYKQNAEKHRSELSDLRPLVDDLLEDVWNHVEAFFSSLPLTLRMAKYEQFGLTYYLHAKEKKQAEAEKLQSRLDF